MAFSYNKKNLANTTITGAITPTQTSVTVADATVFSYAFFYATLMPSDEMSNASNSEIVLVTNIQGNTLTLVRGQENTIARSFPYGAVITNGIYTRDIDYARSIGRKVFMARDDGTDDTNTSYQITDPMIKNVPEEGSIITVEFDTPSYGAPTLGVNNGIGGLVQVSGTDIHITDSSGQIDSVEMYGDTEQQTYSGKNLIGLVDGTYTKNSVTAVVKDGVITFSGTSGATGDMYIPYIKTPLTLAAGTYTHSYSRVPSGSFPMNAGLGYAFNIGWDGNPTTATINSEKSYGNSYRIQIAENNNYNGLVIKPQLELGSTATSFEPYVGGTASPNPDYPQEVQTVTGRQVVTISDGDSQSQEYEVNLGKNLFDKDNANTLGAYIGGGTPHTITIDGSNTSVYIPCQPNTTYTISKVADNVFRAGTTAETPARGVVVNDYVDNYGGSTITLTSSSNAKYIVIFLRNVSSSHTQADILASLQIEKGSTATTYSPYFTPIELCKIGTYQDYIYKSGDDWYVHKETGKYFFEAAKVQSSYYYRYRYAKADIPNSNIPSGSLDMKFRYFNAVASDIGGIGTVYAGGTMLNFRYDELGDNIDGFKTWITNVGLSIYYPLATPTDTQITNATLISELEALYNMLPEGVADVVVTGDLPGSLTIKYYQQGTGTHTAPIVGGAEIDGGDNEQVVELDSYLPYRLVYDTNGYWRVLNKGPKVTTGAIADGAVTPEKLSVNPGKYSTAETIIGSWIDGRPVYRKVLTGTTPKGGGTINHGISNFSRVLNVGGWVQSGSNGSQPIQRVVTDSITQYGIGVGDFSSTSFLLQVGTNGDIRGKPYTLILEYIKTV